MNTEKLHYLLHRYFDDTIDPSDYNELLDYLKSADQDIVEKAIDEEMLSLEAGAVFSKRQSENVLNRIKSDPRFVSNVEEETEVEEPKVIRLYQRTWFRVAAAVLVFASAGLLIFKHRAVEAKPDNMAANHVSAKIIPGSQQATLTVSNGSVIVLKNAANGVLANTGGSKVIKQAQGQIVYDKENNAANNEVTYNTLTTPRGGEYQVVLPDGTKVWLNAASSLTYPTQFTGNERRVKLNGEAYFEVAKNKEKPFYVSMSDGAQVKVLGTHFNISAYGDDEAVTTTLLEGSVQLSKNNSVSLLKPGQQAVVNHSSDDIAVSDANIEDAMAWKNGLFIFNNDNISGIMKKISRWYDVDVYYSADLNDQQFGGSYHRSKNIGDLLQYLQMIGKIQFKMQGRRITVMK